MSQTETKQKSEPGNLIHRLYVVARCKVCGGTPMGSVFPYSIGDDVESKAEAGQEIVDLINMGYTIETVAKPPIITSCECDDPLAELDRCIHH